MVSQSPLPEAVPLHRPCCGMSLSPWLPKEPSLREIPLSSSFQFKGLGQENPSTHHASVKQTEDRRHLGLSLTLRSEFVLLGDQLLKAKRTIIAFQGIWLQNFPCKGLVHSIVFHPIIHCNAAALIQMYILLQVISNVILCFPFCQVLLKIVQMPLLSNCIMLGETYFGKDQEYQTLIYKAFVYKLQFIRAISAKINRQLLFSLLYFFPRPELNIYSE